MGNMKVRLNIMIFSLGFFLFLFQNSFGQIVYTVNSTDDFEDVDLADAFCADKNGNCTLRAALQNTNKTRGKDKVYFDIQGIGPFTIVLKDNFPKISSPIDLDATSQTGYTFGRPQIILDGKEVLIKLARYDVEKAAVGFHLVKGSNGSSIRGFGIGGVRGVGIFVGSDNNVIQQNLVGTTPDGCQAFRNTTGIFLKGMGNLVGGNQYEDRNLISGNGVGLYSNTKNNIIGNYIGTTLDGNDALGNEVGIVMVRFSKYNLISENLISGNKNGIEIIGDFNRIFRNKIGTNASGNEKIPNEIGIRLFQARLNLIGGNGQGNLISGNKSGIFFQNGPNYSRNKNEIKGNYIGLDISGTTALGNETGILIKSGWDNIIGGTRPGEQNVISGNSGTGIDLDNVQDFLIQGNFIGTDALGVKAVPNGLGVRFFENIPDSTKNESTLVGNLISGNLGDGIEINGLGQHSITGNFIGTAKDGMSALPNNGNGIKILKTQNFDCIGGTTGSMPNLIANNLQHGIEILMDPTEGSLNSLKQGNKVFDNRQTDFLLKGKKIGED